MVSLLPPPPPGGGGVIKLGLSILLSLYKYIHLKSAPHTMNLSGSSDQFENFGIGINGEA